MRLKGSITSGASRRLYGLPLARGLLLATSKRVFVFSQRHLVRYLILFQLILDVLCYALRTLPGCVNIVPSAPKTPVIDRKCKASRTPVITTRACPEDFTACYDFQSTEGGFCKACGADMNGAEWMKSIRNDNPAFRRRCADCRKQAIEAAKK